MPDFIKDKTTRYIISIALFYIFIDTILMANNIFWFNLLPFVIFFVYLAFFHLDSFLLLIVFLVPLSIPLRELFPDLNFDLSLPAEPMIMGAMLIVFLKFFAQGTFDTKILTHPVTIAILLNIAWIFIACLTSEMHTVSFKFLIARCWFVVVFYFLASQFFGRFRNMITYIWCYTISFILIIGYFIVRLLSEGISNQKVAVWIIRPFYNDHTAYGAALAVITCALVGIYFIRKKASFGFKFMNVLVIIIYLGAIIFSYTRATWLSIFAAMVFLIALLLKLKLRVIFLILGIAIGVFLIYKTEIFLSLEKNKQGSSNDINKHLKSISNIKSDESNMERVNRWNSALRMFQERPVFGFGPGTYAFKYAPYQANKDKTIISTNTGKLGNAHSEYIGPLAESGLLGSISFIVIVLATLITASKIYFHSKRRKVRLMALTLMIALLTYYIHGLLNNFLDTDKLSALFWGFTAMIVALDVYHNKDPKKEGKLTAVEE